MNSEKYQYAGNLSEFAAGNITSTAIPGVAICNIDGELHAVTDFCTHEGVSFTSGYGLILAGKVICTYHDSVFEPDTGQALDGPALDPLAVFDVLLVDDSVYVSRA